MWCLRAGIPKSACPAVVSAKRLSETRALRCEFRDCSEQPSRHNCTVAETCDCDSACSCQNFDDTVVWRICLHYDWYEMIYGTFYIFGVAIHWFYLKLLIIYVFLLLLRIGIRNKNVILQISYFAMYIFVIIIESWSKIIKKYDVL